MPKMARPSRPPTTPPAIGPALTAPEVEGAELADGLGLPLANAPPPMVETAVTVLLLEVVVGTVMLRD